MFGRKPHIGALVVISVMVASIVALAQLPSPIATVQLCPDNGGTVSVQELQTYGAGVRHAIMVECKDRTHRVILGVSTP